MPSLKSKINQKPDPTNDWTVDELKTAIKKGEESGISEVFNLAQYRAKFDRKNH